MESKEMIETLDDLGTEGDRSIGIRGMFRVQITDGRARVVGDSGWRKNVVTAEGIKNILEGMTYTGTSDYVIEHYELGTDGAVAYGNTDLPGYQSVLQSRVSQTIGVTTSAAVGGWSTLQFTIEFLASALTAAANIDNVGLYDSDGPGGGQFYAGNNFTSSAVATDQQVNVTYNILMGNQ